MHLFWNKCKLNTEKKLFKENSRKSLLHLWVLLCYYLSHLFYFILHLDRIHSKRLRNSCASSISSFFVSETLESSSGLRNIHGFNQQVLFTFSLFLVPINCTKIATTTLSTSIFGKWKLKWSAWIYSQQNSKPNSGQSHWTLAWDQRLRERSLRVL